MFVVTEMISSPQSPATVDCARIVKDENKAIEIANGWIELFYKQVVEDEYDRTKDDVVEKTEDCFRSLWLVDEDVYCEIKIFETDII